MAIGAAEIVIVLDGMSQDLFSEVVAREDADWDDPAQPLGHDGRLAPDFDGFPLRAGSRAILIEAESAPSAPSATTGDQAGESRVRTESCDDF